MNDYNGGTLCVCDYLLERIKREVRAKTIQQSGYLIIKGLLKKKGRGGDMLFNVLDDMFEIPRAEQKPVMSQEELINDFEDYIKGV